MTRALLALALVAALSAAAWAYVRSRTTHGTPTAWAASCALVQPDSAGSQDIAAQQLFPAIQRSMQAWATTAGACSYFDLVYQNPAPLDAHFDGTNTIKFRRDRWCHPDDEHSKNVCYSSVAAGITTVFYVDKPGEDGDGRILDADIELNEIDFTFDIVDPAGGPTRSARPGTSIADLENTLVHELGHLQGLDHTCKDSATPANEVDENGQPPVECTQLGRLSADVRAKIVDATMYNSASSAEIKKRSPEADDVAGVCSAYPIARDPKKCEPADLSDYGKGGGCAVAGAASSGGPLPLGLTLAAIALAFRARPRRRQPAPAAATRGA